MINYPTSLDNFPNPQSTDLLDNSSPTLDHWTQHANINDAVEALEAKVGVDGSAVTTSFDYKLNEITGSDKAVGKTATQTLTNKTLTSPKVNVGSDATADMYYRGADGTLTRIPIGTNTQILMSDGSTPSFQNNPAGSDASTTVKGVVELATLAETLSKTSTGGTGAKLVVTPDNMNSTLTYDYAVDSVGSDAYAITLTPAPTAYVAGQKFTFKAGTANTGACTLNVNSLGAKTIKKQYNQDLNTGDILANQIVEVVYDGTNMQMISSSSPNINHTINADENISNWITYQYPLVAGTGTLTGWTVTSSGGATISAQSATTAANIYGTAGTIAVSTDILNGYSVANNKAVRIKFLLSVGSTADRRGWGFAISNTDIFTAETSTSNGEIRFISNAGTLYAQNANGTTATYTNISSGVTLTNLNLYEIIFKPGTEAKFYINGVLKATHTTNLPTTGTLLLCFGSNSTGSGVFITSPVISVEL